MSNKNKWPQRDAPLISERFHNYGPPIGDNHKVLGNARVVRSPTVYPSKNSIKSVPGGLCQQALMLVKQSQVTISPRSVRPLTQLRLLLPIKIVPEFYITSATTVYSFKKVL